MILSGKKVLITSFSFASFGGAELNAVELAEQLVQFGAEPYFFSYDIDGPLADYVSKKFKTKIITDSVYYLAEDEAGLGYTQLNISDYDYVWVGANTIPISIIKQINTAKKLPKFIFIHMSPLLAFPLDAPLLPELEQKIASRVLSISERTTMDCIYRILGEDIPLGSWPNPVPKEFSLLKKRSGELKNIAVISSSHPTDEVMDIKDRIQRHGITIDYIGKFNDNVQVVNAGFYDKYDLIIGIGKNAKYSLVSGVPIYIYGRFGGDGYLKQKSYETNNIMNYSGRGFGKKTAAQITEEILGGYKDALKFHEKNRDQFTQEFSLDVTTEKLFQELEKEKPKKPKFSEEYINWMVSMQINLMQRVQSLGTIRRIDQHAHHIEATLSDRERELASIYGSKSWKLAKPVRWAAGIVSGVRHYMHRNNAERQKGDML